MNIYMYTYIAMIGTSDQSCWLAEACKILIVLLPTTRDRFKLQQIVYIVWHN